MPAIALLLFAFFIQDPPKPVEKEDFKLTLKPLLRQADQIYRDAAKKYAAAKTSADKSDATEAFATAVEEWYESIAEKQFVYEFSTTAKDVLKTKEGQYVVHVNSSKEMLQFHPSQRKPTVAKPTMTIPITEDQKSKITAGTKLLVKVKMSATLQSKDSSYFSPDEYLIDFCFPPQFLTVKTFRFDHSESRKLHLPIVRLALDEEPVVTIEE